MLSVVVDMWERLWVISLRVPFTSVFSKFSVAMKCDFCSEKNVYVTFGLPGEVRDARLAVSCSLVRIPLTWQ